MCTTFLGYVNLMSTDDASDGQERRFSGTYRQSESGKVLCVMSIPLWAVVLSTAFASVASECDVCHLHYFHKVSTKP